MLINFEEICENTISSKYTPKRTKTHQAVPDFHFFFSGELAYAPEPPSICLQLLYYYFYIK